MANFTLRPEPDIDRDVEKDLSQIVKAIDGAGFNYHAIYLIGGFGRGEGTVHFNGERWFAINDYDLTIISDNCTQLRPILRQLSLELAHELKIDFVDLGCMERNSLKELKNTMQNYDFKYGSYLLAGSDVLHEVPDYETGILPPYELLRLLCNRTAGLLTAKLPQNSGSIQYAKNQYIKASIAIGDVFVYLSVGYHHSYAQRHKMFQRLLQQERFPFELSVEAINAIETAYTAKLQGLTASYSSAPERLMQEMIKLAYLAVTEHTVSKKPRNIFQANLFLENYYFGQTTNRAVQCQDRLRRLKNLLQSLTKKTVTAPQNISNRILFAQPLFYYLMPSRSYTKLLYIYKFRSIPGALSYPKDHLSTVRLWEQYCH